MTDDIPRPADGLMPTRRVRDLLVLEERLVIATDSIGGIGPKPGDTHAADAISVAHFGFRVPLLELICSGARPVAAIDNLCVEMEPTGRIIMAEISRLAGEPGIPPDAITGSTEENVATSATGIGVAVLGQVPPEGLRCGRSLPGDVVLCAGLPLAAPEYHVYPGHPGQVSVPAVIAVITSGLVHDALPVGSRGVGFELDQLAATAGLRVDRLDAGEVSLTKSGGPASCVLFSCAPSAASELAAVLGPQTPLRELAHLAG